MRGELFGFVLSNAIYFDSIFLTYLQWAESLAAASAWAAAREVSGVQPLWPLHLERCTGYKIEDLAPCLNRLLRLHSPDKGDAAAVATDADSRDEVIVEETRDLSGAAALGTLVPPPAPLSAAPSRTGPTKDSPTNVSDGANLFAPLAKRPRC